MEATINKIPVEAGLQYRHIITGEIVEVTEVYHRTDNITGEETITVFYKKDGETYSKPKYVFEQLYNLA